MSINCTRILLITVCALSYKIFNYEGALEQNVYFRENISVFFFPAKYDPGTLHSQGVFGYNQGFFFYSETHFFLKAKIVMVSRDLRDNQRFLFPKNQPQTVQQERYSGYTYSCMRHIPGLLVQRN